MIGGLISIPFIGLIALNHTNFYLSMIFSSLTIFFSGSYFSPGITMMQNSVDKENSGNVVGAYAFLSEIGAIISPIIFGFLATILKAK
jgi:MFS family permease